MTKRIYFITGARSDYDLMSPILTELEGDDDVEASLVVCAAHLSPFHGNNIENIERDGFRIAGKVESLLCSESWEGRSLSFASLHDGLTRLLTADMPDMVFVAGDREEALAGALVACFLRIPVLHSHGGDRCLASDIDEVFRPAISKLANMHMVACEAHAQRLETSSRHFLVIHHPSPTLGVRRGADEIAALLSGVLANGFPVFCSYPNFDPGNIAIRNVINEFKQRHDNLITYHNLPGDEFVALYKNAIALVGNSSSIVTESGYLKVPGVLVGRRQEYREAGPNVLRIEAEEDAVYKACQRCLHDEELLSTTREGLSLYGDGSAARKIADLVRQANFSADDLLKTISY